MFSKRLGRFARPVGRFTRPGMSLALFSFFVPSSVSALGNAPGQICAYVDGILGEVQIYQISDETVRRTLESGPPHEGNEATLSGVDHIERQWVEAEELQPLLLHDEIRTAKGRVRIQFADIVRLRSGGHKGPSVITVGENTRVALREFKGRPGDTPRSPGLRGVFELIHGEIEAFFRGFDTSSGYSVRAGPNLVGIRGTKLKMTYDPGAAYLSVSVTEGEVNVASPFDSRLVQAGQTVALVKGKFLETPPL